MPSFGESIGLLRGVTGRGPAVAQQDEAAAGIARQGGRTQTHGGREVGCGRVDDHRDAGEAGVVTDQRLQTGVAAEGHDAGQTVVRSTLERCSHEGSRLQRTVDAHRVAGVDQEDRRHAIGRAVERRREQDSKERQGNGDSQRLGDPPLPSVDADSPPSEEPLCGEDRQPDQDQRNHQGSLTSGRFALSFEGLLEREVGDRGDVRLQPVGVDRHECVRTVLLLDGPESDRIGAGNRRSGGNGERGSQRRRDGGGQPDVDRQVLPHGQSGRRCHCLCEVGHDAIDEDGEGSLQRQGRLVELEGEKHGRRAGSIEPHQQRSAFGAENDLGRWVGGQTLSLDDSNLAHVEDRAPAVHRHR